MLSREVGKVAVGTALVALVFASPAFAAQLQATGQTTSYQAQNNGDAGPVDVPDDGALQLGKSLKYKVRGDGTIEDLRTGLIWEVKCDGCGGLHDVANGYPWSGDGSTDTIWDWLDQVNAEGGTGYAGHNDWRIPNLRELQSIVDYERLSPSIDPIFDPTANSWYWSSSTFAGNSALAWVVGFSSGFGLLDGSVNAFNKGNTFPHVRAVRGGK